MCVVLGLLALLPVLVAHTMAVYVSSDDCGHLLEGMNGLENAARSTAPKTPCQILARADITHISP
jgi:hypothetical protein